MGFNPHVPLDALRPGQRMAAIARCLMRRTLRGPKACIKTEIADGLGLTERSLDREVQRLNEFGFDIRSLRSEGQAGLRVHGEFTADALEAAEARSIVELLSHRWLSRRTLLWRSGLASAELGAALERAAASSGLVLARRRCVGCDEMYILRAPAKTSVTDPWTAQILRAIDSSPDGCLNWAILEPIWGLEKASRIKSYRDALAQGVANGTLVECAENVYRRATQARKARNLGAAA